MKGGRRVRYRTYVIVGRVINGASMTVNHTGKLRALFFSMTARSVSLAHPDYLYLIPV